VSAVESTTDPGRSPRPVRPTARTPAAVLAATEQLLRERPLHSLSVGDIVDAAGVSRTSFYAHFNSKTAVIAGCLRRVMDQVIVAVEPFQAQADAADDADAAIRLSLERWVEVCGRHGALLRAVSEEWPHDDQLRALWFGMLEQMTAGTAQVIRRVRRAGHAPPGADPRVLAACLMWGYERVLHVALVGGAPGLPDPEAIVAPLAQMMIGSLYGRPLGHPSPGA
jgi:TetR/AcrR family transcriptional regulator, ethionamide resistance regulator